MNEQEQQEQQLGGEAAKVDKLFKENMGRLLGVFKGNEAFNKAKITNSETANIIEELLAEKKEEAKKQFKERASKLIQSKVEFDAFVKAKEKEILDAITAKKKEFNKQIQETFAFLENVDKLRDEYISSLKESEPEKEA
jgi:hypothetical protein